jgi:hypothetical protein
VGEAWAICLLATVWGGELLSALLFVESSPTRVYSMADDRAPVALCGEYAGLNFQKGNIGRKIPQDDSRRYGRIFFGNFKRGARVESIVPMRKEFGNI